MENYMIKKILALLTIIVFIIGPQKFIKEIDEEYFDSNIRNFYGKKSLSQMIEKCLIWRKKGIKILAGNGGFRREWRFRRRFFTVPYCSPQKQLLCRILEL